MTTETQIGKRHDADCDLVKWPGDAMQHCTCAALSSKTVDLLMKARSTLQQANCPECGKQGYCVNERCQWCVERNALNYQLLSHEPAHETRGEPEALSLEAVLGTVKTLLFSQRRRFWAYLELCLRRSDGDDGESFRIAWPDGFLHLGREEFNAALAHARPPEKTETPACRCPFDEKQHRPECPLAAVFNAEKAPANCTCHVEWPCPVHDSSLKASGDR